MLIELLVVENCPSEGPTRELITSAAREAGLTDLTLATIVIVDQAEADAYEFAGSPMVRLNGRDPFGSGERPSLSCRLYPTAAGLRGIPDRAELRDAILREAASRST
ncbi:MAG: hypothetical protein M3O28_14040 [Actinomycetota bacterium]|nr:hypothetical protein [Actinomycetota bacterium]